MSTMRHLVLILLFPIAAIAVDTVAFKTGGKIEGTVIQQDEKCIVLKSGRGTMRLTRESIKEITHIDDPKPVESATLPPVERTDAHLPNWDAVVSALTTQAWSGGLRQIPATAIDVGIMRRVPYSSYRCGPSSQFEVNIYGDPDDPICLEVGVYGDQGLDSKIQAMLIEFAASKLIRAEANRQILRSLNPLKDVVVHGDLTLEITPPTAEDAYGAWWVALYFADRVEKARATPEQIAEISVRADQVSATEADPNNWNRDDMKYARAPSAGKGQSSSSGGTVYVRGYHRKDGTYVRPHTRRR